MSDLISRQDAIDVFEILADKMSDGGQTVMAQAVAVCKDLRSAGPEWVLESAIDYLHNVGWLQEHDRILTESAEPEPKKGEWIPVDSPTVNGRCSVCGYESHLYENDVYGEHYCPNCGARLEWE